MNLNPSARRINLLYGSLKSTGTFLVLSLLIASCSDTEPVQSEATPPVTPGSAVERSNQDGAAGIPDAPAERVDFSIDRAVDDWAKEDTATLPDEGERQILPDLFEGGGDKRVSASGRVLTAEEAQSLKDTVDGFEVELQVKTP